MPEHDGGRIGCCVAAAVVVVADDDLVADGAMTARLVGIDAGERIHAEMVALSVARECSLQAKGTSLLTMGALVREV